MTPFGLAWSNLAHKRTRTAIAVSGVAFAVALIFMEMGLYGGVQQTSTMLFDSLRFDLLLTSSEYVDVSRPGDFRRDRLAQARAVEGVADALPVSLGFAGWRQPPRRGWFGRSDPGGGAKSISMIGAPPDRLTDVFAVDKGKMFDSEAEAKEAGENITRLNTFLYDVKSKPEFGALDDLMALPAGGKASATDPGLRDAVRVSGRRAEIVGGFHLGSGFSWNAMLLGSEDTFGQFSRRPADRVTLGLITLKPGADPAGVQERLRAALPSDVRIVTRAALAEQERRYWMRLTSIGQFLMVAVVLAVVVGVIFVYQMMAADIRNMLPEYATVKALGYRAPYLTGVVLWQALLLAGLGFVPGLAAAFGLYALARDVGGIPTEMTADRLVLVLLLTCGMCLASGLLAVRKVHTADPAELF